MNMLAQSPPQNSEYSESEEDLYNDLDPMLEGGAFKVRFSR
jgi:hypothetical protein